MFSFIHATPRPKIYQTQRPSPFCHPKPVCQDLLDFIYLFLFEGFYNLFKLTVCLIKKIRTKAQRHPFIHENNLDCKFSFITFIPPSRLAYSDFLLLSDEIPDSTLESRFATEKVISVTASSFCRLICNLRTFEWTKKMFWNLKTIFEIEKRMSVWLCWSGCHSAPTPGRDPTTAQHGDFWLLGFPPGPFRLSLTNLAAPSSPRAPILMPSLVRTPSQRESLSTRTPDLKSSSTSGLQVAGLQEYATTPSRKKLFSTWYL